MTKQVPALTEGTGLAPVGQEPARPHPLHALGQAMEEKTPEELRRLPDHGLHRIALTAVAGGEADLAVTPLDDPGVGDGPPRRRASEVIQGLGRPGEGGFDVDHPSFGRQRLGEDGKALRRAHCAGLRRARQGASALHLVERVEACATEDGTQGLHGEENAGVGGEPLRPIGRERSRWDAAVAMAMRAEGLLPGVPNHRPAERPAKVVVAKLEEGLPHRCA